MPKKLNYTPTEDELVVVRRAITSDTRPEVRHRATAMQLLHQGMKPEVVADALAVSVGSIYKWHARWREDGVDGLANQPRSGAPPKADEGYWARVEEVLEQVMADDKPVLLVMDNASYHRSQVAQAGLAVYEERILPLFLPPCGSNLNPIERDWQHLKGLAFPNKLHLSMVDLVATVLVHLEHQNDPIYPHRFSICKDLNPVT